MVPQSFLLIPIENVENVESVAWLAGNAGFLLQLPGCRLEHGLSGLNSTAWKSPKPGIGWISPANQKHLPIPDKDGDDGGGRAWCLFHISRSRCGSFTHTLALGTDPQRRHVRCIWFR